MSLTKADIAQDIAEKLKLSTQRSTQLLESVLDLVKDALASGENVLITGFGKFCIKSKENRVGRNPLNGSEIVLPQRNVVVFKCSSKLRERINS